MKSNPPNPPPTLERAVIQAAVMALTNYVRANYPHAGYCQQQGEVATDPVERAAWRARSETWLKALNDVVELQLYILRYFPEYRLPYPEEFLPPDERKKPRLVVDNASRGAEDSKA